MDLGFKNAGFETIWANEFDKKIASYFEKNFSIPVDKRSIVKISNEEIPFADGIIGGPPCQSWSEAGSRKGIDDSRGKLFYEYIRVLDYIQPKFFVAENVSGLLHSRNQQAFHNIMNILSQNYCVNYKLVNAKNYETPQDRERVIIVGYHKSLNKSFEFPLPIKPIPTLKDALENVPESDYYDGSYSSIYMSRNRVRSWDEQSFTILASQRHIPIHPSSPKMKKIGVDQYEFVEKCRRLSVRECGRIQTFPDWYCFPDDIGTAYKMIGNAVPVKLAENIAKRIKEDLDV